MKLTITLMVSNSIDTIEKCMESLKPILEQVESELIVVDTGGTDGSIDIARKYATEVVPFKWCNDFAAARNAGVFKASGEWLMYLDDDEWFEDVTEIIEFFQTGEYKNYEVASYIVRNYSDFEGKKWVESRRNGLVHFSPKVFFYRPIHEVLHHTSEPEKIMKCYVHHYGYVYKTREEELKHSERNLSIIKEEIKKFPNDHHYIMQIAQEYRALDDFETMKNYCINGVKRLPVETDYQKCIVGWLAANVIHAEISMKDYSSAYAHAKKYVEFDWLNPLARAMIAYKGLLLAKERAETANMLELFAIMHQSLMYYKEHPEAFYADDVLGLGEVNKPDILLGGYFFVIPILISEKRYKEAEKYVDYMIQFIEDYLAEKRKDGMSETEISSFIQKTPEINFGVKLRDVFRNEMSEIDRARELKELAILVPDMAEYCKYLIQGAPKEEINPEFYELAKQVKTMIYQFIEKGDTGSAIQTLNQLEKLVPNDPELEEIRKLLDR